MISVVPFIFALEGEEDPSTDEAGLIVSSVWWGNYQGTSNIFVSFNHFSKLHNCLNFDR